MLRRIRGGGLDRILRLLVNRSPNLVYSVNLEIAGRLDRETATSGRSWIRSINTRRNMTDRARSISCAGSFRIPRGEIRLFKFRPGERGRHSEVGSERRHVGRGFIDSDPALRLARA